MFLEINLVYIQIFRSGIYSEPCQTSTMKYIAKIVNSCSCFRKSFSQNQLFTFSTYLNKNSCFTPEVFIPYKKVSWPRVAMNFDIPMLYCNFLFIIAL